MGNKLTGREIAQIAGVSPTTVSLVKKGKIGVSEEKRKEILQLLKESGYVGLPDELPPGKTIALLIRDDLYDLRHIFYHEVMDNILRICRDQPFNLVVQYIDYENDAQNGRVFDRADTWDAAIVCSNPKDSVLYHLFQKNIPFIVLDSSAESSLFCEVCVDYETAAYDMTRYLVGKGHREIAYLGNARSAENHSFTVHTLNGFQRALQEYGIMNANRVCLNTYSEAYLRECIDQLLVASVPPTALFCTTDSTAIQAIRYLWQKGVRVPQDITVVGMDDIMVSQYTVPALTTMRVDREEMAQLCVQLCEKLISGKKIRSVHASPCRLIERDSVGPPARKTAEEQINSRKNV